MISVKLLRFGPKIVVYSHLNEYIKICEYKRARSLFDPGMSHILTISNYLLKSHLANHNQISYRAFRVEGTNISSNGRGHVTNMAAMPLGGKNIRKLSPEPFD